MVGTSLDEVGYETVWLLDHEVDVQGQMSRSSYCLYYHGPHGDVGDKMAIHHVYVYKVGPGSGDLCNLLP